MKFINSRYLEIYYFLLSLFYFISTKHTWVFRKIYETKGFEVNFHWFKYILVSIFVLYTIKYFKNHVVNFFSKNVLGVILVLDFIPSSIFYSSASDIDWRIYFFHVILFYSLLITLRFKFPINLVTFKKKQVLFFLIIVTMIGTLPYLRYVKHIDFNNLLLKDVYITRIKFRGLFDTYSAYTHSWFTRIIIPIIFVLALKFKLKIIAILNAVLLLFLYLMGAVKSVLLGSVLVVIFYFFNKEKILLIMAKGLIGMLLIAFISIPFYTNDTNFLELLCSGD